MKWEEAATGDSDDNNEDDDSTLLLRSLSKDVFGRRTSSGSEVFSLSISLDATKFVSLNFFALIETIDLHETLGKTTAQEGQKFHFRLTCVAQNIFASAPSY